MADLAERIKSRMTELKINGSQLARLVGVSRGAVTLWLSGTTKSLKSEVAQKVAKVLNVSVEWLVTGKGSQV